MVSRILLQRAVLVFTCTLSLAACKKGIPGNEVNIAAELTGTVISGSSIDSNGDGIVDAIQAYNTTSGNIHTILVTSTQLSVLDAGYHVAGWSEARNWVGSKVTKALSPINIARNYVAKKLVCEPLRKSIESDGYYIPPNPPGTNSIPGCIIYYMAASAAPVE